MIALGTPSKLGSMDLQVPVEKDSKKDAMVRYGKMGNLLSIIALERMLKESTNQEILGMSIVVDGSGPLPECNITGSTIALQWIKTWFHPISLIDLNDW